MTREELEKHGSVLFRSEVKPKQADVELSNWVIMGFDTEYDSKTQELLSVQLSCQEQELYKTTDHMNRALLRDWVKELARKAGISLNKRHGVAGVILVCFWSPAELQFLDVYGRGVEIIEYGMGNYDAEIPLTTVIRYYCRVQGCGSRQKPELLANKQMRCLRCGEIGPASEFVRTERRQTIRILDLQQWFRGQSLARVAKSFGERKLEWDRANVSAKDLDDPAFREYAMNDAHIAERIYIKLRQRMYDLTSIDIVKTRTPANTSASAFRSGWLSEPIKLDCASGGSQIGIRRLSLLANWGGNNQSFVRGLKYGRVYQYDAVSMYPSATMVLGEMPRGQDWFRCITEEEFLDQENIGGICQVRFRFPATIGAPCLPVFLDGSLLYPLSGESYCTLAELRVAIKAGADIELVEGYAYQEGSNEFPRYLQYLFNERMKVRGIDPVAYTSYKLLMNSVIGKLVQKTRRRDVSDLIDLAHSLRIPPQDAARIINLDDWITSETHVGTIFLPEWSTLILGYSRATLAQAFLSTHPYAGTTDSLLTTEYLGDVFVTNGITFEMEETYDVSIYLRTRLYSGFKYADQVPTKLAHHAVHNRATALDYFNKYREQPRMTRQQTELIYTRRHVVLFREALFRNRKFGEQELVPGFRTSLAWDNKRRLTDYDSMLQYSRPWLDTGEYLRNVV